MQKKYFSVFIIILVLFVLTSCKWKTPFFNSDERNKVVPFNTKIEKSPLLVEFLDSTTEEDRLILLFQASHNNQSPLQTNDYDFHFPKYIFDENNVPYEVTSFELLDRWKEKQVEDNFFYIKATIHPAPNKENTHALLFPLFITPSLFESGYPVFLEEEEEDLIVVGDLTIRNIKVEEKSISFIMNDNHPEASDSHISYTFRQQLDGHSVYPVFQTISSTDLGLHVELEFSQNLSLPLQLNIQRTTTHLPEWKFPFIVPLENN